MEILRICHWLGPTPEREKSKGNLKPFSLKREQGRVGKNEVGSIFN